jgi:hypothetical protein
VPEPEEEQQPTRLEWPMDRTAFSVCNLEDQDNDLEYWLSRTPDERIQAIEYMRHMLYGTDWKNDKMVRVLEIVDLPPGEKRDERQDPLQRHVK